MFLHYQNPQQPNKFYGLPQSSQLEIVINPDSIKMKNFNTLNYQGSGGWEVISLSTESTGADTDNDGASWNSYIDTASRIYSYVEGAYQENGIQYYAGFNRKQNKYVASINNATSPQIDEVIYGDSLTGTKGYYLDVTLKTDSTTEPTGIKRIFSVGATYNLR